MIGDTDMGITENYLKKIIFIECDNTQFKTQKILRAHNNPQYVVSLFKNP
jgi:hypothetical protein